MSLETTSLLDPLPVPQTWNWKGLPICYQHLGDAGSAVLLIHGFGASWGHWRKNIPVLAERHRVYALDLLGFGGSAKPQPGNPVPYTFETWSEQIRDFCKEVIGEPVVLVGNSIGCIAAMQAAVDEPEMCLALAILNCSIRMLHERRLAQLPWYRRVGAPVLQRVLGVRWLGHRFFRLVARRSTVRNALNQAYADSSAVTDELVELLLAPASDEGAADVFLAFTRYSQGPLPEDLLPRLQCPALVIWGEADPWEPIEEGRRLLGDFPQVDDFVVLDGVGHCPQDESPKQVNRILMEWIERILETSR
ncbi:MAG: alpha/beta fold hydrolase [Leptolyngbyaceae bacterium]|nr:alpha/beta fold hydrolase [Leptolyngbyaceae bacterium]